MKIRFNSLKTRLIIALLLIAVLPTIIIGWLAHNMMSEHVVQEKISGVGSTADAKHKQLVMTLILANSRAEHFLSDLGAQCGGNTAKLDHRCATDLVNAYLAAEGAIGAYIDGKSGNGLTIGNSAVENGKIITFRAGQLAQFSSIGPKSNHSYFISAAEESTGFRLSITYPSSALEPIFTPPPKYLGLTGETFLADGDGYFATKPRYASTQGHTIPISAHPMQTCLNGQSLEMLDLDYRGAAIIHGFRFVPEFGSACIMAHITQAEAFAPLNLLRQKLVSAIFLFCLILVIAIIYLTRNLVKPITKLTSVTRAITAGDYMAQADVAGSDEILELYTSFNVMTNRLVQSEKTLNEAQQLAHIGSWERDLITNSFTCSEEVFHLLEIDPAHKDISYEAFILAVHPEDREMVDRAYLACIQAREPFNIKHRLLLSNGRKKWVNERGNFFYDSSGVPLRSMGTVQDITEQYYAEEQLRIAAATFETYEGIVITDAQANIIRVNRAFQNITGYSLEEVIGKNPRIWSSGRQSKAFYAELWQRLLNNGSWAGEMWNKRRNGQIYPEWLTITAVKNEQGKTTGYVAIFNDITERKKSEKALMEYQTRLEEMVKERTAALEIEINERRQIELKLREYAEQLEASISEKSFAEDRVRQILESTGDGLYGLDDEGRITFVNPAACQMLGYEPEELAGKNAHAVFHHTKSDGNSYPVEECPICATLLKGVIAHKDDEIFWRKDAQPIPVEYTATPIRKGDWIVGTVVGFNDISMRKHIERELQKSKEAAEAANRAKSDFLSNMSHEIRTPINGIIGMTYLALKTDLSPKQRDYLDKIHRSSQHLIGIINEILDFSKIEAGKLEIETVDFELNQMLHNVSGMFAEKAAEKGIEFIFDIAPSLPLHLRGDPLRLSQILINYASNAVKFTQQGEIIIRARGVEETEGNVLVRFEVQDSGLGMNEEVKAKLFQSFQQADTSTTRKYGGTGLGLSISKQLAKLMGGTVGVESEPDKGSTFWCTAWLGKGRADAAEPALPLPHLGKLRILVVDDHPHARQIIIEMLGHMGVRADGAESGEQGLSMAAAADNEGDPYDLAIIDWRMPGMDGAETSRRLGDLKLARPPARIMMTAYSAELTQKEAENAGVSRIFAKPLMPPTLLDAIKQALPGSFPETSKGQEQNSTSPSAPKSISGARVLLVEDNAFNQQVATEILEEAGVAVCVANNGYEALDLLRQEYFECILMDMQMPEMDGIETTQRIRANPALPGKKIIAMTANASKEDREKCFAAGMDDFISKPFEPEHLYAMLAKWLPVRLQKIAAVSGTAPPPTHIATPITGTPPGDPQVIDLSVLAKSVGNDPAKLRKFALKFLESAQKGVAEIEAALERKDVAALAAAGHRLKSSSRTVGALGFANLCNALEQNKDDVNMDQAHSIVARLRPLLEQIKEQVNE